MRRKCWWLTVVLCLLAGVQLAGTAQAGTAQAGTTADYTDDLLATRLVAQETGGLVPLLRLPARQLAAGEKVWLTARLAGRSDAVRMPRMAIRVDGVSSTGTQRSTIASINHDGQSHGTQYVTTRWLFTAPAAGSWTITARAEATSMLAQPDGSRPSILPVQGDDLSEGFAGAPGKPGVVAHAVALRRVDAGGQARHPSVRGAGRAHGGDGEDLGQAGRNE